MTQTFELVCHATKQRIWVGHGYGGPMTRFYSGVPEVMEQLRLFLVATKGHELVLMCTDTEPGEWMAYSCWRE